LFGAVFIFVTTGCSQQENKTTDPGISISDEVDVTERDGEISTSDQGTYEDTVTPGRSKEVSSVPTQDDVNLYNKIMKRLYAEMDRKEADILSEMQDEIGMSPDEAIDFLQRVMPYATGGKQLPGITEPKFLELISYAETAIEGITGQSVSPSVREDDWSITKTNLRYVMRSDMKIGGISRDVIVKIEFSDTNYTDYIVFQLKIDGINIDL
jgi:hypothetical protein